MADKAGISKRTMVKIEAAKGIPATTTSTIHKIQLTLEAAGIEFIGTPTDAPGIRIHAQGGDRDKER